MDGLNHILANRSQLRVLRSLCHADAALTGRGVERETGLSNRATMMALEALTEARVVNRVEQGCAHLYSLNRTNYLVVKGLKPMFEAEELFWHDVGRTIQRIVRPKPLAAVATGPLARDETDYGGRLLLTMLFSTGRNRIRALASIGVLAETVRDRHGLTLESSLLDTNTMDREEYAPLWRRVEREGILLFGTLP